MAKRSFESFVQRALTCLEREQPAALARCAARLAQRRIVIRVDAEAFALYAELGTLRLDAPRPHAEIELLTSRPALVALIDGERSLVESVLDDDLSLRGAVFDLLALEDVLEAFLHGAVRSARVADLLVEYLDESVGPRPRKTSVLASQQRRALS